MLIPESSNNAQDEIDELLCKYYAFQLTEEEEQKLEEYCKKTPGLRKIMQRLDNKDIVRRDIAHMEKMKAKKPVFTPWRIAGTGLAAAFLLIIIKIMSPVDNKIKQQKIAMRQQQPIADTTSARLRRWDGQTILLTDHHLSYYPAASRLSGYDTLETPRSGQCQVTLPDGSGVWLNNASSVTYPAAFTGNTREVYLSGEAYFEIVKNTRQPFLVHYTKHGKKVTTHVLGTSFNISAYPDDVSSRTTLLTGSIQVTAESRSVIIKPDQQLVISLKGGWRQPKDIEPDDFIAWRTGLFHFDGSDLRQAFRDIGRWYGVRIEVVGQLHAVQIEAGFKRGMPLLTLLNILSHNGKNFKYDPKNDKILISQ